MNETIQNWDTSAGIFNYVDRAFDVFSRPLGLLSLSFILLFICYVIFSHRGKWIAWSLLVFMGIQGRYGSEYHDVTLISPFEQMRNASRMMFVSLLITLFFRFILFESRNRSGIRTPAAIWLLLVLHILYAIQWALHGDLPRGIGNPIVISLLVVSIALLYRNQYRTLQDVYNVLTGMQFAGVGFAAISIIQYFIRPGSVVINGRLTGISGNPNFAGIFSAVLLLVSVYLFISYGRKKRWRIWDVSCIVLFAILLFWSGSRTGAWIGTVGLVWMLRFKLKAWVFIIPLGVAAAYLLKGLDEEGANSLMRLTSLDDTGRFQLWAERWKVFLKDPIFGSTPDAIENSYVFVAGSTGAVGLLILLLAGIIHFRNVLFVWRSRLISEEYRLFADFLLAWSLAWALAAGVEPFLLGIATASVVFQFWLITFASVVADDIRSKFYAAELTPFQGLETT